MAEQTDLGPVETIDVQIPTRDARWAITHLRALADREKATTAQRAQENLSARWLAQQLEDRLSDLDIDPVTVTTEPGPAAVDPGTPVCLDDHDERRIRSVILEWLNESEIDDARELARKMAANLRPTIDAGLTRRYPTATTPDVPQSQEALDVPGSGAVSLLRERLVYALADEQGTDPATQEATADEIVAWARERATQARTQRATGAAGQEDTPAPTLFYNLYEGGRTSWHRVGTFTSIDRAKAAAALRLDTYRAYDGDQDVEAVNYDAEWVLRRETIGRRRREVGDPKPFLIYGDNGSAFKINTIEVDVATDAVGNILTAADSEESHESAASERPSTPTPNDAAPRTEWAVEITWVDWRKAGAMGPTSLRGPLETIEECERLLSEVRRDRAVAATRVLTRQAAYTPWAGPEVADVVTEQEREALLQDLFDRMQMPSRPEPLLSDSTPGLTLDDSDNGGGGTVAGADWAPLGEDVSTHTMLGVYHHDDERMCMYHSRLAAWAFGFPTDKQCLRAHPRTEANPRTPDGQNHG